MQKNLAEMVGQHYDTQRQLKARFWRHRTIVRKRRNTGAALNLLKRLRAPDSTRVTGQVDYASMTLPPTGAARTGMERRYDLARFDTEKRAAVQVVLAARWNEIDKQLDVVKIRRD